MNDTLLILAGLVGASTAVVHGLLMQTLMINPLLRSDYGQELAAHSRRLIPMLLHFTTLFWFIGGICLIAAPFLFSDIERFICSIVVGAFYFTGAIGNFLGTRGKHPGWVLLAISVILIVISY